MGDERIKSNPAKRTGKKIIDIKSIDGGRPALEYNGDRSMGLAGDLGSKSETVAGRRRNNSNVDVNAGQFSCDGIDCSVSPANDNVGDPIPTDDFAQKGIIAVGIRVNDVVFRFFLFITEYNQLQESRFLFDA